MTAVFSVAPSPPGAQSRYVIDARESGGGLVRNRRTVGRFLSGTIHRPHGEGIRRIGGQAHRPKAVKGHPGMETRRVLCIKAVDIASRDRMRGIVFRRAAEFFAVHVNVVIDHIGVAVRFVPGQRDARIVIGERRNARVLGHARTGAVDGLYVDGGAGRAGRAGRLRCTARNGQAGSAAVFTRAAGCQRAGQHRGKQHGGATAHSFLSHYTSPFFKKMEWHRIIRTFFTRIDRSHSFVSSK